MLADYLHKSGIPYTLTREPGGTPAAEKIRDLVLDPALGDISGLAELLLIEASRSQHVDELIRPALERGKIVVCDRYIASSLAYQGYGRGVDLDIVRQVNRIAVGGCVPDLTIYLDLPLEVAKKRRDVREEVADRLEQEGESLQEKVARGYREISNSDHAALILDARRTVDQLAGDVREALRERWHGFPFEENRL
jgi:dTMP kinase